jgi:glycosyltransferase involved in cell wall biosynthesis
MRLLWISHSSSIGGAELSLSEGVRGLTELGHELHVVLPTDGPLRHYLGDATGIHICHHNPWMTERGGLGKATRWLAYNITAAVPAIARLVREIPVDMVLSTTVTTVVGALVARATRRPHVWFLQEFSTADHGLQFIVGRSVSMSLMRRMGDRFAVTSQALFDHYAAWLPRKRLRRVHYAIDVRPAAARDRRTNAFRLALVGSKSPSKGQHEAIAATSAVVSAGFDVTLDLIGSSAPSYETELATLIDRLGLKSRVRLLPAVEDPAVAFASCDAVLMCSRAEGFGRVTVEAMKYGKPVVGAASGATPELIQDGGTGYLYPPGDTERLATSIERLCADTSTAEKMGQQGQAWAARMFNMKRYQAELDAILTGLMHPDSAGSL